MLITFTVENWRSFKVAVTLNLTADRRRSHWERLADIKPFAFHTLPVAGIYGANASGKSAFIEALAFFRDLVVNGTRSPDESIPVHRFKLDPEALDKPVKFGIDVLIGRELYTYEVKVRPEGVESERLTIEKEKESVWVFAREAGAPIAFNEAFFTGNRHAFMKIVAGAARRNQLFLTTAAALGGTELLPLYDYLNRKLVVIAASDAHRWLNRFAKAPDVQPHDPSDDHNAALLSLFAKADTGIDRFVSQSFVPGVNAAALRRNDLFAENEDDEVVLKKLVALHKTSSGEDVAFSLSEESAGTHRLLDLMPVFSDLCEGGEGDERVYVIDEIDRSLHPELLRWLIERFLHACGPQGRGQLIFTAHDVNLLDPDLFRPDELWGVEKNVLGVSRLYSFGEFKELKSSSNFRQYYLQGLLGAMPDI